jgi:hypothetical protein
MLALEQQHWLFEQCRQDEAYGFLSRANARSFGTE